MAEIANPRYCPTAWLDEVNPLADTPEGFVRREGGVWLLIDPDHEPDEETFFKDDLVEGQIVNFARLITHDDFTLTIRENGSYSANLPQLPSGHTAYRLSEWEWEDSVDDLEELIRLGFSPFQNLVNDTDTPLQPGSYTVECWTWQDQIPFRFAPEGEVPKFVLCAGAN
jgi:hypothetical protein